jgi:hypothetical protein
MSDIRDVSDEWARTVETWRVYSSQVENELNNKSRQYENLGSDFDKLYENFKKLHANYTELVEAHRALIQENVNESRDKLDFKAQLRDAKKELAEIERTNVMNYAEKKVFAAYSRELRNASGMNPVFEPLLYAGDKGAWIRERVRMAALRVYNAGGDIRAAADAAVAEMRVHVKVMVPSEGRRAQIEKEKVSVLLDNIEVPDGVDPTTMFRQCMALHPC